MSALLQRRPVTSGSPPSAAPATPPQPKPRRWAPRKLRETLTAYGFLLPWFIGLFCITLGPILASLYFSFTDYSLIGEPSWVGLVNYRRMLDDERRHTALQAPGLYVRVGVARQPGVAHAVALRLARRVRALSLYRSVYYLPALLGGRVAAASPWRQIFGGIGVLNRILAFFRIQGE